MSQVQEEAPGTIEQSHEVLPLVVDLDGTLVRTDTRAENLLGAKRLAENAARDAPNAEQASIEASRRP